MGYWLKVLIMRALFWRSLLCGCAERPGFAAALRDAHVGRVRLTPGFPSAALRVHPGYFRAVPPGRVLGSRVEWGTFDAGMGWLPANPTRLDMAEMNGAQSSCAIVRCIGNRCTARLR